MFAMTTPNDGDQLLTVKDIMAEWGLGRVSVLNILGSGEVPNTFKFSRRTGYRVPRRDWEAYVQAHYVMRPKRLRDNAQK